MFKKLKKMLMVLLIIPALFVFGACKNKNNNPDSGNPPAVTPSTPEEPGSGDPSTPEEPGGEDPTPSAENYVVSVEYCLPEGFEVLSNYSVTKEVGQTFTLPEIADENLSEFFLGWYDKATEELITEETLSGTAEQTITIQAKWSETTLKNYYYTPGLTFALTTDFESETIVSAVSYEGNATKVIVPKFYEIEAGVVWPVRMIGQGCFSDSNVEKVSYSSDGLIIGKNAFTDTKITAFDFTKVLYIDEYAFSGSKITEVEMGALVQGVGAFAFANCADLESVDYSASSLIQRVSASSFANCAKLTDVALASSVKFISESAFSGCVTLPDVAFLQGIEEIEQYAFKNCTSVKNVVIYDSINSFADTAFDGCTIDNLSVYNLFADSDLSRFSTIFGGLSTAKNLELLGENILQIRQNYFENITTLESVSIADSVTMIGQYAFAGCLNLAEIEFSENLNMNTFNVTAIQDTAWYKGLTNVTYIAKTLFYVPATVSGEVEIVAGTKNIISGAFKNNENITSVKIPASVEAISVSAFEGCLNLETVVIESGSKIAQIAEKAFLKCSALASINLENCELLTTIKANAFKNAGSNIVEFKLPKNLANIESNAFYDSKIAAFNIDASASNFAVENGVLFNKAKTVLFLYPSLKNVEAYQVPATVALVKNYAFVGNSNVKVVLFDSNVTFEDIGGMTYAFDKMSQPLYLVFANSSSTIKSRLNNLNVCYEVSADEFVFEQNGEGDDVSYSFEVDEESVYEFVTGNYFVEVNNGGNELYFIVTLNVSGETISVENIVNISNYFA